jgi:hypothetical protein
MCSTFPMSMLPASKARATWVNMSKAKSSPGWFSASYRAGSHTFGVSGVQQTPTSWALTCT